MKTSYLWPWYRLMVQGGLSLSLNLGSYSDVLNLPEDEAEFLCRFIDRLNEKSQSKHKKE